MTPSYFAFVFAAAVFVAIILGSLVRRGSRSVVCDVHPAGAGVDLADSQS